MSYFPFLVWLETAAAASKLGILTEVNIEYIVISVFAPGSGVIW